MPSRAANTPRSRGTDSGRTPSTTRWPPRATMVAVGRRPTKDHRPHRSACSTDSRRNPGSSPTTRTNPATGVVRSASSSFQTGTTEYWPARARNSSRDGRIIRSDRAEGAVEAAELAGVTGPFALLFDHDQKGVAVAVVVRLAYPLPIARGLALAPVLLAATAPKPGPACLHGALHGVGVHPCQHPHPAGTVL